MALIAMACLLAAPSCRDRAPGTVASSPTGRPGRLVVLTPSLVEIVFALGLGPRVVGVTKFAVYPEEAQRLPQVGDFLQPSVERIVSLRPDLVLLDAVQVATEEALKAAGVRTLALPITSIAEVKRALQAVGDATGVSDRAAQLVAGLDRELAEASARSAGGPRPRVLFAVDREVGSLRGLVGAGPATYLDELIRRAGGDNVLADAALRFVRVSPEEIVARRPDVILDAGHHVDAARAARDWDLLGTVPAVRDGRVFVLDDPAFVSPGPRLGLVLRRLTALLHPAADGGPGPARTQP